MHKSRDHSCDISLIVGNILQEVKVRCCWVGAACLAASQSSWPPRASLSPKKAVDFLSDKPIEIELVGTRVLFNVEQSVALLLS